MDCLVSIRPHWYWLILERPEQVRCIQSLALVLPDLEPFGGLELSSLLPRTSALASTTISAASFSDPDLI